ncbi:hypothetical protein CMO96_00835 [Candidatus Woesebacteria bacterium]|nr:hypothetical protein [Candidatus Woesebacteria bacterium]|tara:strand:- start:227 stop:487 length:261 start_codon:yes stop_codon:yes gene_type:complete
MKEEDKDKAVIAIANSILTNVKLSDVLQIVQSQVLTQAKEHVGQLGEEELTRLMSSLEEQEAASAAQQQEASEEAVDKEATAEVTT